MYARYIPPAKEPSRNIPTADPAEPSSQAISVPPSGSATPYARYIPPPKSKADSVTPKRKIVFDLEDPPVAEETSNKRSRRDSSESKQARERESNNDTGKESNLDSRGSIRKSKKLSAGSEKPTKPRAKSTDEAADTQEFATDDTNATALQPKSKKKDKKQKSRTDTPGDDGSDKVVDRHKAVLAKKEKSLTRPITTNGDISLSFADTVDSALQSTSEAVEEHGLEPLPQPEPISIDRSKPLYETLPPWLAEPIRVSAEKRAPFSSLGLNPELGIPPQVEKTLHDKGWAEAFAVQTAVMPLLMPMPGRQGDLVISAATGSGKTLAYVLPMMRDLSREGMTRLRGLIVVPTRELVQQAKEVCEACAVAFAIPGRMRVKIGVAMGSQSLPREQSSIMEQYNKYDPEGYRRWKQERVNWPYGSDLDLDTILHAPKPLPFHVVDYIPKVDVLICTPGRLVEHIKSTPGFNFRSVRWLVIDEADKLLGQSYQQWLELVMEKLDEPDSEGFRDFADSSMQKSGVRKVVLSATMTKDLSLLNSLRLRRPKHIVLEGTKSEEAGDFVLPDLLEEFGLKIREESQKPLYLVELLNSRHIGGIDTTQARRKRITAEVDDQTSSSESSDSEATSTSSESDFETSSSSSAAYSDEDSEGEVKAAAKTDRAAFHTSVLVFTKSNESALRLSRLVGMLAPGFSSLVGTLTSTIRTSERRKILRSFTAGKLRILIASDIASRGLDLPHLDHVINYDMPTSVASYVHRVGRTARAGRSGKAWTLFTKKEAGWFWPEVAGQGKGRGTGGTVKRANKVEKIVIGGGDGENVSGGRFSEQRVAEYEAALEKLGQEAVEGRRKGKPLSSA